MQIERLTKWKSINDGKKEWTNQYASIHEKDGHGNECENKTRHEGKTGSAGLEEAAWHGDKKEKKKKSKSNFKRNRNVRFFLIWCHLLSSMKHVSTLQFRKSKLLVTDIVK